MAGIGRRRIHGPYRRLEDLHWTDVTIYTVYWPLTIGLVIMAIVLFAPGGVLGLFQSWFDRMTKKDDATVEHSARVRQDENAP